MVRGYTDGMVKKILFLEGPIQTGKSTLIRRLLGDHLSECGGFTSQRLIGADGKTRGFRLGPAAQTPLTAPAEDYIASPGSGRPFIDGAGIFKWFPEDGHVITDQSVFEQAGADLLRSSMGKPLILLDEIGGSELLCDAFCTALEEVLSCGAPCLGVMKLMDGARRIQGQYPGSSKGWTIADQNEKIRRKIIEDLGGKILYYERGSAGASNVEAELLSFIRSVFPRG